MAFKNEYIPPLEQETSEFLKRARETLRTGYSKYDAWTVDREHDMVLQYVGGGVRWKALISAYGSLLIARGITPSLLNNWRSMSPRRTRSQSHISSGDRLRVLLLTPYLTRKRYATSRRRSKNMPGGIYSIWSITGNVS